MTYGAAPFGQATAGTLAELLKDGIFIDGDWVESKDQDPDGEVRLIQLADVGDGEFRDRSSRFLTLKKAGELGCTFLETGDVLVARMPEPLGRACVFPGVGQLAVTVVDVCILRPNPGRARSEWLVKAINSPQFRRSMAGYVRGTTRQRISRRNLGSLTLEVPDIVRQVSQARSVDLLEEKRKSASDHVAAGREMVQRLRQSVLASACDGRLTADWREANEAVEPAEALCARLEGARRMRRGPCYAAQAAARGEESLPRDWCWTTIGALVDVATGGTPLRSRSDYYGGSVPWVTSGAVNSDLITEASEYITQLALDETNAKVFPPGTLLVAMYGEGQTRGRVAELQIHAATNQAVAALLFDSLSDSLRPYLRVFLQENYERIRQLSFGGVQRNLSLGVIRDTVVPLPPANEQEEIVRRVRRLTLSADRLREGIDLASNHLSRVRQAFLTSILGGGGDDFATRSGGRRDDAG